MSDNAQGKIKVIGVGVGRSFIHPEIVKIVKSADLVVGGERILSYFCLKNSDTLIIKGDVSKILLRIEEEKKRGRNIVVLSDGDPLFFGIGSAILRRFKREEVIFFPNVTVLQVACAKIGIPWDRIKVISLHGREDISLLLSAVMNYDLVGVYTDKNITPKKIAKELVRKDIHDFFSIIVFEDLGLCSEKVTRFKPCDVMDKEFSYLNFVIIEKIKKPMVRLRLGIDDDEFLFEKGMITKKEIRSISLSKLCLEEESVLWDVGAGCGSVGIEAASIVKRGKIFCIEKKESCFSMIKQNIKRTGAFIVEPVLGEAPDCLSELPEPDRIFIGGGVTKQDDFLERVTSYLKNKGIVVLNVVLLESLKRSLEFFKTKGWEYEVNQVFVSRSKEVAEDLILKPLNPVFIIKAIKG